MSSDNGSAAVLLALIVVIAAGLAGLVVSVGQLLSARGQAQVAADAAALAAAPVTFHPYGAAGTPAQEAVIFAAANDARLTTCRCPVDRSWEPRTISVQVEVTARTLLLGTHRLRAGSRARFSPPLLHPNVP